MTISFSLGPEPIWYFANLTGGAAGDEYTIGFYKSLDKSTLKPVYRDSGGISLWDNPTVIEGNGTKGPFYFEFDTDNPDDLYYIRVEDKFGELVWDVDNYVPDAGSGGGSVVTNAYDLDNYLVNGEFLWGIGTVGTPNNVSSETNVVIAAGLHTGFNRSMTDIRWIKAGAGATDNITFKAFSLGNNDLVNDVSTAYYANIACSVATTGETVKCFQFPICHKVQNLQNESMTFRIWGKSNSGNEILSVQFYQYFGSASGASSPVLSSPAETFTLTANWTQFTININIPTVSAKVLGSPNNNDDGLFLRINFPLDDTFDVDIAKPSLYLGDVTPNEDFASYDEIEAKIMHPRSGDIRLSFSNQYTLGNFPGWVACNDLSIGNSGSGATNRANGDTFSLYQTLWDNVSDTYAPVTGGRGLTASADFEALKPMFLPRMLGRVLAGALPDELGLVGTWTNDPVTDLVTITTTTQMRTGVPVTLSTDGIMPTPLINGRTYYAIIVSSTEIQLALTPQLAIAGTFIDLTTTVTGNTIFLFPGQVVGQYLGEFYHTLTINELAEHDHPPVSPWTHIAQGTTSTAATAAAAGTTSWVGQVDARNTGMRGNNIGHLTMQPTTYVYTYLKL